MRTKHPAAPPKKDQVGAKKRPAAGKKVETPTKKPAAKSTVVPTLIRKKRRNRPGTVAKREIKKQADIAHKVSAFRKLPFNRLIREVAQNFKDELRFTPASLEVIRAAADDFNVKFFTNINKMAGHAKRITIMEADLMLGLLLTDKNLASDYVRENHAKLTERASQGIKKKTAGVGKNKTLATALIVKSSTRKTR
jgi:histone H3